MISEINSITNTL